MTKEEQKVKRIKTAKKILYATTGIVLGIATILLINHFIKKGKKQ
jgi:hypothetical protein